MSKQKNYLLIGIIAIIIIILIWIGVAKADSNTKANGNTNNHEKMNHTTSENQDTNEEKVENYLKEETEIMSKMMKDMENISNTGNATIDFLNGMIPHHQSAVEMSESYLKYGAENAELKQIAETIIETQTNEIEQMKLMIQTLEQNKEKEEENEAAYLKEYEEMLLQHSHMNHIVQAPKSVDEAFAQGMIMHHQMASDMSKSILNYSNEEEVKTFAQTIIDVQEKEIKQMQDILNNL